MNRLLIFLGLRTPKSSDTDDLVHETRELRNAILYVGDRLSAVSDSLKETTARIDASGNPLEDMMRGRYPTDRG